MARFSAVLNIDPKIQRLADDTERQLQRVILPRVMDPIGDLIKQTYLNLPQFPDSNKTGSKRLMSRRARYKPGGGERWGKMRENVIVKKKNTKSVIMRMVGVTGEARHVNFDHGKKALTTGRIHKLWWIDGVREKYARVNPRIQQHDIAVIVKSKTQPIIEQMIATELNRAVQSGELLR